MGKTFVAGVFAAVLMLAGVHFAVAQPAAPGDVQVKGLNKSVTFPHSAHAKAPSCQTCHHKANGNEPCVKCSSSGCHDDLAAREGKKSLHAVVHGKNLSRQTCLGCHKKAVAAAPDRKKELTGCKGSKCHP